jgi:mannose-6-phosphate isomerase-like protein (cupin superfamily)
VVNGKNVELTPENMVHIEPNDIHYVEKVLEAPLQIVVVTGSKINDKVTLNE